MLDFAFRHHFWQHYCLISVCGVFLTVDFLPRCFTKIQGRPAGTNLPYKVHQIVNISSSGFGSNICSPFSLRPDVPFVCQGRIVSLFLFFSFLFFSFLFFSFLFFCCVYSSPQTFILSSGTSANEKREREQWMILKGMSEGFVLSDICTEGGMSFFAFFSVWL